jgi:serine/threonine protein kinase
MAPESLEDNKFSTASDVWSFGVVMWEMDNPSEIPYSDIKDATRLGIKLAKGLRLQIPKAYPPKVERIVKACWQEGPELRPSFMLIAQLLTSFAFTTSSTTIT